MTRETSRLNRVLEFLRKKSQDASASEGMAGADASEVAAALSIHRSDASAALNALWRRGLLVKGQSRPVRYVLAETDPQTPRAIERTLASQSGHKDGPRAESDLGAPNKPSISAFQSVVGANGSIKAQVQLARAAVSYPPHGLHTLIVGESGVGKSLLAEEMWRYGQEIGAFLRTDPFVLFSCAEYADNPQLVLSQLFGHCKGAFTGAQEDKPGLVERAEGGILFLDEIHRLPPTGQELLFTVIDKGLFRRLGETKDRSAHVMIIGATSEDPNSVLLVALRRRIPVTIHLPRLAERPPNERLALIVRFLSQESNRLGLPIQVSGMALQVLATYDCKANIGDLKNDLQLCCARGYLSYLSLLKPEVDHAKGRSVVAVDMDDLPQKVYSAFQVNEVSTKGHGTDVFDTGLTVEPGEVLCVDRFTNDYEMAIDLYGFVQRRLRAYRHLSLRQEEIESAVGRDLERYFYAASLRHHDDGIGEVPAGIITPAAWEAAKELLNAASIRLLRNYSRSLSVALALHIQQFIERTKAGEIIYNPHLNSIKEEHGEEMSVVLAIAPAMARSLGSQVPEDEAGFLAMFLTQPKDEKKRPQVGLVVAAHGRSTASSMADVANKLLATNHIRAVDAPLDQNLTEVFDSLCRSVTECDQGKGVLILADMGSFVEMEDDLARKTGIRCRVIPNAGTTLVLEAGKVALTSEADLDEMVSSIISGYVEYSNSIWGSISKANDLRGETTSGGFASYYSSPRSGRPRTRGAVLAVCPTGAGTARKIREILVCALPIARVMDVIPVSALDDVTSIAARLGKRLRLVIGSINPGLNGVPYIGMDEILQGSGLVKVDRLLKGWDKGDLTPELPAKGATRSEALALIAGEMHRFAPSLMPTEVMVQCRLILDALESRVYRTEMPVDLVVRVCLHSACMFDRLSSREPLPTPVWGEDLKRQKKDVFELLQSVMVEAGKAIRLTVPESEVYYFLATLPDAL